MEEKEIWGTWEELLLACAVNRHGTRRWESVAMEIQARTSVSQLVTPQGCRQRYRDLQRRFGVSVVNGSGDDDGGDADPDSKADVPWLEELRRLRVTELRREVERYDMSIGSLQLKVKSLQEERERSLRQAESGEEKPDHETKKEAGPLGSTPESLAGNRISSGGDSVPSCDQSHSNDPQQIPGEDCREQGKASASVAPGSNATDPSAVADEKAAEGSYNGSTGSPTVGAAARKQAMGDSGESIAESKRGEEGEVGEKESSDVQSSASLSRRRRKAAFIGRSGGGEEAAAESQPLVDLVEIFRSDKYGSVFERRLENQVSVRYRSLVRQHVDLEMVRAKLDRRASGRSYSTAEFFRDLLLLCSNAVVFFPKDSLESVAAVHLRRLVTKELDATFRTPKEPTPPPPPQPKPAAPKPNPEPDLAGALTDKTISSPPPIVSRKRSSISNKVAVAAAKKEEEEEEEKPDPARKESDNEEKSLTTKERTVLSGTTRGLRSSKVRGGKGDGGSAAKSSNLAPTPGLKSKPVDNVAAVEEVVKPDKKKQSATSFLNRMKRSSNGTLMEMLKSSSGAGGGREQKKEAKGDARKDQSSRQATGGGGDSGKKVAEASGGSGKRSVGRPPKRAAAYVTPPPAKRKREEAEAAAPAKTPASTSRKRRRR